MRYFDSQVFAVRLTDFGKGPKILRIVTSLSLFLRLSLCLCLFLSVCLSLSPTLSLSLSVSLSLCLSLSLCVTTSCSTCLCLSVSSVCLSFPALQTVPSLCFSPLSLRYSVQHFCLSPYVCLCLSVCLFSASFCFSVCFCLCLRQSVFLLQGTSLALKGRRPQANSLSNRPDRVWSDEPPLFYLFIYLSYCKSGMNRGSGWLEHGVCGRELSRPVTPAPIP